MKTEKYAIREFQIELNKIFGKNFVENLIKIQDVRAIKLRSRKKIYFCKPCLDLLCKRENKIEIFRNKEIMKVKSNCKKNKSEIDDELFQLKAKKPIVF
jgi:RNase P subunit RPR2